MPQRVGILTFHCTDNPGSVLQAYALQQTVRSLGCDCDIINYQRQGWLDPTINGLAGSVSRKLHIPYSAARFLAIKSIQKGYKKYDAFRKDFLTIFPKEPIKSPQNMKSCMGYTRLITGSDQIWNFRNPKVDETFFLRFTECSKKIAYAASFGTDAVDSEHRENVAEWLSQIPYLSVRELQGAKITKDLTGRDVQVVLDPSLLLTREQWMKIAKLPKEKNYILVYVRERRTKLFDEAVLKLSQQTGLKIIELTPYRSGSNIGKHILCPGPQEWLGYFLKASYIITNSFHGMAFSLNFNKQFYSFLLNSEPTNSRISGILEQFSLQDRIITENTDLENIKNIDYVRVNTLLQLKREDSLTFLENALKGGSSDEGNAGSLSE